MTRASVVLAALSVCACTRTVGTLTIALLTSSNVDENPLPADGSDFTIEVRVEGPGAGVRRDSADYVPGQTHLLVPAVTVGDDRIFTVTVRNARGEDVARGRSLPHDMTGDDETLPIYLSKVGLASEAATRMTVPRFRTSAQSLPDGTVLIAGGGRERVDGTLVEDGDALLHAEIFDPTSGSIISEVPDCERSRRNRNLCLLCARTGQVTGADMDGSPVLAGGDTACHDLYPAERFVGGRFLPGLGPDDDETIASAVDAAAFETPAGLVVAGGLDRGQPSARAALIGNGRGQEIGGLNVARYGAAAASLPGGGGVVVGGFTSTPSVDVDKPSCDPAVADEIACRARGTVSGAIEVYDPDSGTFELLDGGLAEPRAYATATALPDGRVAIVGGLGGTDGVRVNLPAATVEVFDPAQGVSCIVATLLHPHWLHATLATAARENDGRILIFGGYETGAAIGGNIELLDLSGLAVGASCRNPLRLPTDIPQRMRVRRAGHTALRMENGAILLAGGVTPLPPAGLPGASDSLDVFWLE